MTPKTLLDIAFFAIVALVVALIGYMWTRAPAPPHPVVLSSPGASTTAATPPDHPRSSHGAARRAPLYASQLEEDRNAPPGPAGHQGSPVAGARAPSAPPVGAGEGAARPQTAATVPVFAQAEHLAEHHAATSRWPSPTPSPRCAPPDSAQPCAAIEPPSGARRGWDQSAPPVSTASMEHPGAPTGIGTEPREAAQSGGALRYHVQVGAFRNLEYANELLRQLRARGFTGTLVRDHLYRVWVGGARSRADAERLARRLEDAGFQTLLTLAPSPGGLRHAPDGRTDRAMLPASWSRAAAVRAADVRLA